MMHHLQSVLRQDSEVKHLLPNCGVPLVKMPTERAVVLPSVLKGETRW